MAIFTTSLNEAKIKTGIPYHTDYKDLIDISDEYKTGSTFKPVYTSSISGDNTPGGILDSIAQNHIEQLDFEKEKMIYNSKYIVELYSLYISGHFEKAIKRAKEIEAELSKSKSAINYQKTNEYGREYTEVVLPLFRYLGSHTTMQMYNDYETFKWLGISDEDIFKLICNDYYGLKFDQIEFFNRYPQEKEKLIRDILRFRLNYVNTMIELTRFMLIHNSRELNLSKKQIDIYIKALDENSNNSVKAIKDIKKQIQQNKSKFLIDDCILNLSKLGLGTIYMSDDRDDSYYSLDNHPKNPVKNEDAIFRYLQHAFIYDAVVVSHGFGGQTEEEPWECVPVKLSRNIEISNVNDIVRYLIKNGKKKILLIICNPYNKKLDSDILKYPGVEITYSQGITRSESTEIIDYEDELNQMELSLQEFSTSIEINYSDDIYLDECYKWYLDNITDINEGKITDSLKSLFKKILAAIVSLFKKIINFFKSVITKVKQLFSSYTNEEKDVILPNPVEIPMIDIKSENIIYIKCSAIKDIPKNIDPINKNILSAIKEFQKMQERSMKDMKEYIDSLNEEELIESVHHDNSDMSFFEDANFDLLGMVQFIKEFQDDQGNVIEDDEEDEDYSIDDEEGTDDSSSEIELPTEPTPDEESSETPEDGSRDDEYSMDDVDEEDETSAEPAPAAEEEPATEPTSEEPTEGQEPDNGSGDDAYELPDDEEGEATEDDTSGGEEGEAGGDALGGDDEYSMDDMGEGDDTSGEDTSTDDTSTSSLSNEPASDEASVKLRELESVVFDSLSDAEKRLKIKDLKELYTTVYKKCDIIYNSLSDIKRDEETIQIIEYISNTLIDLKRYVGDYIINLFDIKTYVENLAQLQKYIMIFTAINQVFEQIRIENDK